jgi:ornithine cyclodeaminase
MINLKTIRKVLPQLDLVSLMENGFVAYSEGRVVVPPVGEMIFEDPPGDTHIKYGYIKGGESFVIKVASGFYNNPQLGLSSSQGLMLLFSQKTGVLESILLDEGHLTNVRTAAAGAVAAKHLAPCGIESIGILGAGIQGKLQLEHLMSVVSCRQVSVWVPDPSEKESYLEYFSGTDMNIEIARTPEQVAEKCGLIVTATPAKTPLLKAGDIRPGTHITAMGSDTAEKNELDPEILGRADLVVVDSLSQSESRGEVFRAVEAGVLNRGTVVELGAVVSGKVNGRTGDEQITVCDLTGVAVQDLMIAEAVSCQVGKERGKDSREISDI